MLNNIFSTSKKVDNVKGKCLSKNQPITTINKNYAKIHAFTIIELMVGIAVLGIITAVAMPSLNQLLVSMRVDNEISQIQRLVLSARNSAVSMGFNVTICPLDGANTCAADSWDDELSVFIDLDSDNIYEPVNNETLLKVKSALTTNDTLTYAGFSRITFAPTGTLAAVLNSTFLYCPQGFSDLGRSVVVSASGRAIQSSDVDNDSIDEDRNGVDIACP